MIYEYKVFVIICCKWKCMNVSFVIYNNFLGEYVNEKYFIVKYFIRGFIYIFFM